MGIIRSPSINRTLFGRYYINWHARGAVVRRKRGYRTTKHGLIANNNRKGGLSMTKQFKCKSSFEIHKSSVAPKQKWLIAEFLFLNFEMVQISLTCSEYSGTKGIRKTIKSTTWRSNLSIIIFYVWCVCVCMQGKVTLLGIERTASGTPFIRGRSGYNRKGSEEGMPVYWIRLGIDLTWATALRRIYS